MALARGDKLGGYRLVRIVGEGGMGVVWEAEQISLGRRVALKIVRPQMASDTAFVERFQLEARLAGSLNHPNVVVVHDSGLVDGQLFMSMALVEGPDLSELIAAEGALPPARAIAVLADVAAGLDAAHSAGLVHRDVKPANILLGTQLGRALISDFGVAKARDVSMATGTGNVLGTLRYSAPEQMQGKEVDSRADIYSLGAVLFEMLTGEPPFGNEGVQAVMWAHMHEDPPKASGTAGVPAALDAVVARAMAKEPEDRYSSATEMALDAARAIESDLTAITRIAPVINDQTALIPHGIEATQVAKKSTLRNVGSGSSTHAQTTTDSAQSRSRRGRRLALIGVGLALGLLAGGAGAIAVPSLLRSMTTTATSVSVSTSTETSSATTTETVSTDASYSTSSSSSDVAAAPMTDYSGIGYSAQVPQGWTATDARLEGTAGSRTKWINPDDPNTWVLIETTPNDATDAYASAVSVKGSREGSVSTVDFNGVQGAVWDGFYFKHQDPPYQTDQRVDYFTHACSNGVAILGSSSPTDFQSWAPTFRAVAESINYMTTC